MTESAASLRTAAALDKTKMDEAKSGSAFGDDGATRRQRVTADSGLPRGLRGLPMGPPTGLPSASSFSNGDHPLANKVEKEGRTAM